MSLGKLDFELSSTHVLPEFQRGCFFFIERSVIGKMHFIESCRALKC